MRMRSHVWLFKISILRVAHQSRLSASYFDSELSIHDGKIPTDDESLERS